MMLELAQAPQVFLLPLSRQWPCLVQPIAQNVFGLRMETAQRVAGPALSTHPQVVPTRPVPATSATGMTS